MLAPGIRDAFSNQCTAQTHSCVPIATCIGMRPVHKCQCPNGFEGTGFINTDLSTSNGTANSDGCALTKRSIIIIAVTIPVGVAIIASAVAIAIITHSNQSYVRKLFHCFFTQFEEVFSVTLYFSANALHQSKKPESEEWNDSSSDDEKDDDILFGIVSSGITHTKNAMNLISEAGKA